MDVGDAEMILHVNLLGNILQDICSAACPSKYRSSPISKYGWSLTSLVARIFRQAVDINQEEKRAKNVPTEEI